MTSQKSVDEPALHCSTNISFVISFNAKYMSGKMKDTNRKKYEQNHAQQEETQWFTDDDLDFGYH